MQLKYLCRNSRCIEAEETDCLLVFLQANNTLGKVANAIDKKAGGLIRKRIESGDVGNKSGDTCLLFEPPGLSSQRLLIVATGDNDMCDRDFIELSQRLSQACVGLAISSISLCLDDIVVKERDLSWTARLLTEAFSYSNYRFDDFKTTVEKENTLETVSFLVSKNTCSYVPETSKTLCKASLLTKKSVQECN